MSKYIKIYSLFEGFLKNIDIEKLTSYEKKLLNLLKSNFDNIVDVGTYGGKRAELLAKLIKNKGDETSERIDVGAHEFNGKDFPIKKITSLEIDSFRGFDKKEQFTFDKLYTLVYGPNGSGKSSFCDALEYALLGYINEAISKRIDIDRYVINVNTRKFAKPSVKAIDQDDKENDIQQAPDAYNFCFIEKNRITNFARISANTPLDRKNLLSTLFGLEEFNKFAMNFTDNFTKYIDIEGEKQKELTAKKQEIVGAELNIKDAKAELARISSDKDNIIKRLPGMKTFEDLDVYIHGDNKKENQPKESDEVCKSKIITGRIKDIDQELNKSISTKCFVKKYEAFEKDIVCLDTLIAEYSISLTKYSAAKEKVDYKNLYEAIISIENVSKDKCPACQTPIEKTVVHPYDHARRELIILKDVSELEQIINKKWDSIKAKAVSVNDDLKNIKIEASKLGIPLLLDIYDFRDSEDSNNSEYLCQARRLIDQIKNNKTILEKLYNAGIDENIKIDNIKAYREKLSIEKQNLQEISDGIKRIKTQTDLFNERVKKADELISKFKNENTVLIKEAEEEKKYVTKNIEYLKAYNSIVSKLKVYNEQLPIKLVENLNDLTRDFYNIININDKKFELLECVELPVSSENSIKVAFKNKPGETHDALHILSEGHIRCLGLAILLAKNVADNRGIIIFDDVVNAIDDEHRDGIRELLFKEPRIKNKQIILTSHAEEFIKDLDNQFNDKEYGELVKRITFLRPSDARSVKVHSGESTFNYLIKAQNDIDSENKRDCLMNCRRALENITAGLWKKLTKIYKTEITVKMRHPKYPPDLLTIVRGLRCFLENAKFPEKDAYVEVVTAFKYLEGLESSHKSIWEYLNKGTHDETDRKEFDRAVIVNILETVRRVDNTIK